MAQVKKVTWKALVVKHLSTFEGKEFTRKDLVNLLTVEATTQFPNNSDHPKAVSKVLTELVKSEVITRVKVGTYKVN